MKSGDHISCFMVALCCVLYVSFLLHVLQAIKEEINKQHCTETDGEVVDPEKKLLLKGVFYWIPCIVDTVLIQMPHASLYIVSSFRS